ncbi:hypothetical protein B566_EDAN017355 [Ephemera danica]|nr:hypothetical protein B566_EDAN017355 [Ephemera danica]
MMSEWRSVVGLEIHAQITSASKLFSGAGTEFGSAINQGVSFFDAAIPGTLPALNRRCVEAAVLTALALDCRINPVSFFDRKHYFYADLPAGYQITQQRAALAYYGELKFQVFTPGSVPYTCVSKLKQLQLEQDSGKSLHDTVEGRSLVDLNRAGVPLMELVFEPDLRDGEEAAALVKELSLLLQTLGTCSAKMEEGALRVDANVSVQRGSKMGPRTEIKNIGSVRGVANAIASEIARQLAVVTAGGTVVSETRAYDAASKSTVSMRDKEERQDYRFMPEPNLPPLRVALEGDGDENMVSVTNIKKNIPELPEQTRRKLQEKHGLSLEAAFSIVGDQLLLKMYTDIMKSKETRSARLVSNLILQELLSCLHKNKAEMETCPVSSTQMGDIVDLVQNNTINLHIARKVLQELVDIKSDVLPSKKILQRR